MSMKNTVWSGALALAAASGALAQIVINEALENPPGSTDERYEYIELYGAPGMSLNGYALALLKGGQDSDANGVPDPGLPEYQPEVDEAFSLDGYSLSATGFFVLYNNTGSTNFETAHLTPNPSFNTGLPDGPNNKRYLDGAGFNQCHVPSTDVAGKLGNDYSSTYVLVRRRPLHSLNAQGQSVYAPGYSWRKDVVPDVDFNSRLDFADPAVHAETPSPGLPAPLRLQPYQMVDDVSWSNLGGKEYTRSTEQELSDTPGFNPDGVCRVAYYGVNPMRGWRMDSSNQAVPTRMADEEFIYGDLLSVPALDFDATIVAGERRSKGPTNPSGPHYNSLGQPDALGAYLFDDINTTGFRMTPNAFNDVDSTGAGGVNIVQFRFVRGDFDFNSAVALDDLYAINERLDATLDDTASVLDNNSTPAPADDFFYTGWKFQGRDLEAMLAMLGMDATDGAAGANNPAVTARDILAERNLARTGETIGR